MEMGTSLQRKEIIKENIPRTLMKAISKAVCVNERWRSKFQ